MSGLVVEGLTVRFGAATILNALSLAVSDGEFFVLLGGSGSGKTTLLRAIAGFAPPDTGRIVLNGVDLTGLPAHRRPVNTIFQSYALFPHMTVAENIGFGLRRKGVGRAETAATVARMLALVRLEGFGDRAVQRLSGGQQQRVALARGLAANPALLLLDEPLSALDRGLRQETRADLAALQKRVGASFVLVTHDQDEALSLADRVGVMRDGVMVQVDTPAMLYERPNCRYVAEFLGAANILPVTVGADGLTAQAAGAGIVAARVGTPGPGLLALRPERLRLDDPNAPNRLAGVLVGRSYRGEVLEQTVDIGGGTILRVARSLRDGLAAVETPPGTAVVVSWYPDASILLPCS